MALHLLAEEHIARLARNESYEIREYEGARFIFLTSRGGEIIRALGSRAPSRDFLERLLGIHCRDEEKYAYIRAVGFVTCIVLAPHSRSVPDCNFALADVRALTAFLRFKNHSLDVGL